MTATDVGRRFREAVGRDLLVARKARDEVRTRALRSVLGAVDNAGAIDAPSGYDHDAVGVGTNDVPRRQLDEEAVRRLVHREISERRAAEAQYRAAGHGEMADDLVRECDVLAGYLDPDAAWTTPGAGASPTV